MSDRTPRMVLCAGEPLVGLVPLDGAALTKAQLAAVTEAGAELNVAMNLAQLGVRVRFAGAVGADPWGRRLTASLESRGVDVSAVHVDSTRPTGMYVKELRSEKTTLHYYRSESAASAFGPLSDAVFEGIDHLHISGVTAALSPETVSLAITAMRARGLTVSFDVNFRPALWSPQQAAPVLLELALSATTVFVGLNEARELWGCGSASGVRALIPQPRELVVTDGPRATTAFSEFDEARVSPPPMGVVDVVGAGDGFAAGYLAARWSGCGTRESLAEGHRVAALVMGGYGDNVVAQDGLEGLLTEGMSRNA